MARHLIVTWDGAGNLVSTLGIARRLVQMGHDVRLMGRPSIEERSGSHGWRFVPFRHAAGFDNTDDAEPGDEFSALVSRRWCSPAVAADVQDELASDAADVVLVDCMLWGGLSAAQASGVPTVALFHAPISLFRSGPMVLASGLPVVQELRRELGLPEVSALSEVQDACDLSLVATAREFDVPVPLPDGVRFVGPILDGPTLTRKVDELELVEGDDALVVVSFSTSFQVQLETLQRIVDALGELPVRVVVTTGPSIDPSALTPAANTQLVGYVPHEQLLGHASLMVTHAGLGTVMAALTQGVPMVCVPMGRDQFFNAAMVERIGAGLTVEAAAAGLGEVIARYGGATDAVESLEALANA